MAVIGSSRGFSSTTTCDDRQYGSEMSRKLPATRCVGHGLMTLRALTSRDKITFQQIESRRIQEDRGKREEDGREVGDEKEIRGKINKSLW
jgi:hypothetical protein